MSENRIYSFIGLARKAGALALGEGPACRMIRKGKACLVIIARDASLNTKKKIETALYGRNVPVVFFGSREQMGHALGKMLFSVITVTHKGFAEKIIKMTEKNKNNDNTAHGGGFFEQTKNT